MNTDDDIRPALHKRIAGIDAELADIRRREETLSALRKNIEQTLAAEDLLAGEVEQIAPLHPSTSGMGLADLLIRLLETGPKSLEQLKDAGAGWPHLKGHSSPGRAINFALVGMMKGGHVSRLADGRWKLK